VTRAQTRAVAALAAALDDLNLDKRQRFRAVVALLYAEGERLGVSNAQLHNGGISEVLVAHERGHTIATSIQGSDSYAAGTNAGIEQKNAQPAILAATSKRPEVVRRNFNYEQPAWPRGTTTQQEYLEYVRAHWLHNAPGGHELSCLDGADVRATYAIDGAFMADYLVEQTRRALVGRAVGHVVKHNLGCTECLSCGRLHRIVRLQERAAAWLAATRAGAPWQKADWDAIFSERVPSDCRVSAPAVSTHA